MTRLVFVVLAMALLAACAQSKLQAKGVVSSPMASGQRHEDTAVVKLRLPSQDLRAAVDQDAEIWRQARQAAMLKLSTAFLVRRMVMPLAEGSSGGADTLLYSQKGNLRQDREEGTGDFVQSFRGTLLVDPRSAGTGRVVGLETAGYMAGNQQYVYVSLPNRPATLPAYVAIFKPQRDLGEGFYRLGGIGEVMQLMEVTRGKQPTVAGNVEIFMADRETEVGDLVVPLVFSMEALAPQAEAQTGAEEEVVVRPQIMPSITEPKVKK